MPNRPDYLAIWLGLTRIGGVVALINTNLAGEALAHCLHGGAAQASSSMPAETLALERPCGSRRHVWRHGEDFSRVIAGFSGAPLTEAEQRAVSLDDPALLIYTSGTTGLPKAAFVSHRRVMMWTHWFAGMMDAGPQDRLYNCLPMYHRVGGVVASGAVLLAGGAVILREKFSASALLGRCRRKRRHHLPVYRRTCAAICSSPEPQRAPQQLAPDLRQRPVGRYLGGLPEPLLTFRRSWNSMPPPKAISRFTTRKEKSAPSAGCPAFLEHRFGIALVKRDRMPRAFRRGPDGFCQSRAPGEAGEAIGRIAGGAARFEGYSDAAATAKKILRNVFEPGDAWVRTRRPDAPGRAKAFIYFVDRLGDTFRWKGENVATTEVAAAPGLGYPGVSRRQCLWRGRAGR